MLQPNTNVSETIDSLESLIKQLRDENIFLRVKLRDKMCTRSVIKAQWGCLFRYWAS